MNPTSDAPSREPPSTPSPSGRAAVVDDALAADDPSCSQRRDSSAYVAKEATEHNIDVRPRQGDSHNDKVEERVLFLASVVAGLGLVALAMSLLVAIVLCLGIDSASDSRIRLVGVATLAATGLLLTAYGIDAMRHPKRVTPTSRDTLRFILNIFRLFFGFKPE